MGRELSGIDLAISMPKVLSYAYECVLFKSTLFNQWAIDAPKHQKWLYGTRTFGRPPSVSPQWLSSGSWQIGGIMNSDMLGECGCKHMLFFALQMSICQLQQWQSILSPSSSCCSWNGRCSYAGTLWTSTAKQTGLKSSSFEAPGDFGAFVWSGRLSCSVTFFFTY